MNAAAESVSMIEKPVRSTPRGVAPAASGRHPKMRAIFTALAKRVRRFEVIEAERALHNILRGFRSLRVEVS
jgi:hypothetical protein